MNHQEFTILHATATQAAIFTVVRALVDTHPDREAFLQSLSAGSSRMLLHLIAGIHDEQHRGKATEIFTQTVHGMTEGISKAGPRAE